MVSRLKTPTKSALTGLVRALGVLLVGVIIVATVSCARGFRAFANDQLSPKDQALAAELKDPINAYLQQKVGETGFGGRTFCAHKVFAIDQSGDHIHAYIYGVCQEYYLKGQDLTKGTGSAVPAALVVQKDGAQYRIVSHETPHDGASFSPDVERIFPPDVRKQVYSAPMNNASILSEIENQARQFFHK